MIASSIPILQPLLEKILRRNPFSSGSRSKSYKYTDRHYAGISDQKSGVYELGQRKPKSKVRDDLGLTVLPDDGSQEEILAQTKTSNDGGSLPAGSVSTMASKNNGHQVMRTDMVTVTYENESEQPHTWGSTAKAWGH